MPDPGILDIHKDFKWGLVACVCVCTCYNGVKNVSSAITVVNPQGSMILLCCPSIYISNVANLYLNKCVR